MRTAVRWVLAGLLVAALTASVALSAALQGEPAVAFQDEPGVDDIARAVSLLRQHDPRHHPPGRLTAALLDERDVGILLDQVARRWLGGSGRITLLRRGAVMQLSARAPANPFGRWINVELKLAETGGLPAIDGLRVGRLPLPAVVAEQAGPWLARRTGLHEELLLAADVVQRVRFMPRKMQLSYVWRGDSTARMMAGLLPGTDLQRLRVYSDRLSELALREREGWTVPLGRLLGPMFALARSRSAAGGDAVAENRAALLVLTLFVNGRGVADVLPAARTWSRPPRLRVLAAGRDDSPQHFLVSAALAAEAGGTLSRVVGLYKEVADSRGGSGFSFSDLAADRAGTRFGELAVQQPLALHERADQLAQEQAFLPPTEDLPDNLPEPEFRRRFGGVGAPAYTALLGEIDRRVSALAVFR